MFAQARQETGPFRRLAEHMSFDRSTVYGRGFQMKTGSKPSNVAFTSSDLGLHTDVPYANYPPGVQFLHSIIQTPKEGDMTAFSEALNAAMQLRRENPDAFRLLVETPVDYIDDGSKYCDELSKMNPHFTVNLDSDGEIHRVMYGNQTGDSRIRLPSETVEKFLRALHQFDSILYRKGNLSRVKPEEDVCCVYNEDVPHGRPRVDMTPDWERHLAGMYTDVDEATSKPGGLDKNLLFV